MTVRHHGFALGAAGIALLCAMDAVAKALGAELSAFQVVFLRYLGSALCLALWIAATGGGWPRPTHFTRQALRALMLVVTASMFFHAVARLPLALVAALAMTAPVYMTLIGAVFFKERMRTASWLALALGAAGSGIIIFAGSRFDAGGVAGDPLAWASAILAPLGYAATLAVLKHHSSDEPPAAMSLGQSLLAALLVLPLAWGALPVVTPTLAGQAALIGLLGASGFLFLIEGIKRMPVSVFAVLDYTALVWAALFGLLFFGEVPGLPLWAGGVLIIAACVINARTPAAAPAPG